MDTNKKLQIKIDNLIIELALTKKELAYQNSEKSKRADELELANKELLYQQAEKADRADELVIANIELLNQHAKKVETKNILDVSEARYRELIRNLDAGVIVHSADTSIILNNEKACELLGISDDMLKGKKAYDPAWNFIKENMERLTIEEYPVN